MTLDVTQHPEYPFGATRQAAIEGRAAGFLDAPPASAPEAGTLREFLVLASAFAFLERLVQGDVLCDLPAHLSRVLSTRTGDPEEEGERLAEAEEDLLDWRAGSIDSLADALDATGVKVFLLGAEESREAGTAGGSPRPPGSDLFGAFCFQPDVGPAVLTGAPERSPEATFVLAHELGHLVADVDPYRSRFCRWDPRSLANRSTRPEESRADRFARALLMPASAVLRSLHEMGPVAPEREAERVELLAAIFSAPGSLVRRRLADLGVLLADRSAGSDSLAPGGIDARGATHEVREQVDPGAGERLPLPERFVNLALAAYAGRALTSEVLARFLRTTEEEALRVADWAGVHRIPAERSEE